MGLILTMCGGVESRHTVWAGIRLRSIVDKNRRQLVGWVFWAMSTLLGTIIHHSRGGVRPALLKGNKMKFVKTKILAILKKRKENKYIKEFIEDMEFD